jgi:hypothetical protein
MASPHAPRTEKVVGIGFQPGFDSYKVNTSTLHCYVFSLLKLMDKSLWLVVAGLLHTAAHDLCVQHLLTAFRTAVSI